MAKYKSDLFDFINIICNLGS